MFSVGWMLAAAAAAHVPYFTCSRQSVFDACTLATSGEA